jgi:hypothetical protein
MLTFVGLKVDRTAARSSVGGLLIIRNVRERHIGRELISWLKCSHLFFDARVRSIYERVAVGLLLLCI